MRRSAHFNRSLALLAGVSVIAGCVNPDPAFRSVQTMVGERTGKRVSWIRTGADVERERQATRELLRHPLTADTAAQIALLNNRRLQADFEEIGISVADYVQAALPSNPDFSGMARFPHGGGLANIELAAAQNLLDLLLIPMKRKIARAELRMAKLEAARSVLELITETKIAFYNLQARQQLLSRLKLIAEVNESSADLAKRRHDAGNIPDDELAGQQAAYTESRVNVAQAEAQIRSDRERLNRLMGVWGADIEWKIGDRLPEIPASEVSLAQLESKALSHRFDIAIARQNVEAIGQAAGLQKATRFLPGSINAGVNTERDTDGARVTGPMLELKLPIFDQGQARLAKLMAQYRQAQNELEAVSIEARSEVREARDLLLANRELANYYGKILLPQRIQVVNTTQLQYNAMQRGPTDLFLAKEQELNTEQAYIEAWRDYWVSRAELEMALKGGSLSASAGLRIREAEARRKIVSALGKGSTSSESIPLD